MAKDINLSSRTPLLLLLCFTTLTEAVWLTIPSKGTKCMSEEIQTHVVVLADYYVVADDVQGHQLQTISAKVYKKEVFFIEFSDSDLLLFTCPVVDPSQIWG